MGAEMKKGMDKSSSIHHTYPNVNVYGNVVWSDVHADRSIAAQK
jgi:hypothetical protein